MNSLNLEHKLDEVLTELILVGQSFSFTRVTLLGDMILMAFINDVTETASVIKQIAQTEYPHRAFANARTAFEAAQQAIVLATQDDYVNVGTRAWIYFCRKDSIWLGKMQHKESKIASMKVADDRFYELIRNISSTWENLHPNAKNTVDKALQDFLELDKQKSKPDNWLRVSMASLQEVALEKMKQELGLDVDVKEYIQMNHSIYSMLSREAHTGLRMNKDIYFYKGKDGSVKTRLPPRDNDHNKMSVLQCAIQSVIEVQWALEYRIERHREFASL